MQFKVIIGQVNDGIISKSEFLGTQFGPKSVQNWANHFSAKRPGELVRYHYLIYHYLHHQQNQND